MPTPTELSLEHIDELGTPASYNHYNTGWAWAFDTPFPYWKRWAGYEGGIADMCLVSWPAKVAADTAVRSQYVHAVDVVPTIYDLVGITPPDDPQRLRAAARWRARASRHRSPTPDAPGKRTQFYAMLGQRALYEDGWLACTMHPPLSSWGKFDQDVWELYHVEVDRSQSTNVADAEPERVQAMVARWFELAEQYNGLPLDDRNALEQMLAERPSGSPSRDRYVYYPDCASVPEQSAVAFSGRSYTISAGVDLASADAEGVLFAQGGVAGGHSLFVQDGRLHYLFNWVGTHLQKVTADRALEPGAHVITAEFVAQGRSEDPMMAGARGPLTLYVDGEAVGSDTIVTQPGAFCVVGDGLCVGRDDASPVSPTYTAPFRFTGGTIDKVVIDVSGERYGTTRPRCEGGSSSTDEHDGRPAMTALTAPRAFHVMSKPTGAICNLDCEYCFFLSKDELYPGSGFRMPPEVHEAYIAPAARRPARRRRGGGRVPGRRADPDGARLLPPHAGAGEALRGTGAADPEHDADQRDAARRRVVRVPEGERLPRRGLDRRAARDARRLPGRQGRQADLRPGRCAGWTRSSGTRWSGTR